MDDFVRYSRIERVLLVWGKAALQAAYTCELRKNAPLRFTRGAAHYCVVVWQATSATSVAEQALYEGDPILVVDAAQLSCDDVLALCAPPPPGGGGRAVYALHVPYWLNDAVVRVDDATSRDEIARLLPLVDDSKVAPTREARMERLGFLVRHTAPPTGYARCSACFGDIPDKATHTKMFIDCSHPLCDACDGSIQPCMHRAHRVAPNAVQAIALGVDAMSELLWDV